MQYIQLWELQLLTAFMLRDKSNVSDTGLRLYNADMALTEDTSIIDEYMELINAIKRIIINKEPVFNIEPYTIPKKIKEETDKKKQKEMKEHYIEISRDCAIKLNISAEELSKYLKEYSECYAQDEIVDKYSNKNRLSYKAQLQKFRESINTEFDIKHYKIKEGKYLPVLLIGYFNGLIKFNCILTEFPEKMVSDNVCIIEQLEYKEEFYNVLKEDFWETFYDVDISEFMKISKKKTQTDKKGEDDYLNEIREEVNKLIEAGQDKIYYEKLADILKDKLHNKNNKSAKKIVSNKINILNTKYKEQHGSMLFGTKVKDSSGDYYPILTENP